MKETKTYLIVLLLLTVNLLDAQLLVSPNNNAATLVNQIVGNNVTITNAVINCGSGGSGIFLSNNSNIGLNNGILLTTGKATNAMGTNNDADKGECFNTNSSISDPQLIAIEPKATYDGCVLEFDIKPICNTLQIKYVFGSEEYPEFVGSQFNDAFGFFIWGPNPAGGTYNGNNIARLPNSTQVTINNINNGSTNSGPCTNCGFYVNNTGGGTIQYDGFTTPLTASANVTPCQTYHLKLAIADAGDCDYDSGVFLEYQGISCSQAQIPTVATQTTTSFCDLNNGSATATVGNYTGTATYLWSPGGQTSATAVNLAPGNYQCQITFQNPCPYTKTITVQVPHSTGFGVTQSITNIKCPQDVNGSATVVPNGGNAPFTYSWNTNPVQTSATATGLGLGTYVCTITDATGCVKKDSVRIFATTTLTMAPTSNPALCNNATGEAMANTLGGVPPYTYVWNTSPVQTSSIAVNLLPGNYSVTVTDNDGCIKTLSVNVSNFEPAIAILDSVVHATCNQPNGAIIIDTLIGGTYPYTFNWSGGQTTQSVSGLAPGAYSVTIRDANNCPAAKLYAVNNFTYLPINSVVKDDKCDQKKGEATATVLGGTAPISYTWSNGQTTQTASGLGAGSYNVIVKDAVGCTNTAVFNVSNYNDSFNGYVTINPRDPSVNENFQISIHPTSLWTVDFAGLNTGFMLRDTVAVLNLSEYGWYYVNYFLVSDNGCRTTIKFDFFVKDFMTLYFPNTFTPNADGVNDIYYAVGTLVKEFKMQIYDRWGEQVFNTDDLYKGWDGKYKGSLVKEDTYTYKALAKDYFGKAYNFTGHINVIR